MKGFSGKKCRENQNTHFMPSNFISENHAICEIMWKNMVEPRMPQMMVRCMCFACWISKATDTH
jgi:hypothetical protein